jgi:DNA-binding NtrC family response regulator
MVAIVDDDELVRSALQGMLKSVGLPSQAFASAEEFLKSGQYPHARMPDRGYSYAGNVGSGTTGQIER